MPFLFPGREGRGPDFAGRLCFLTQEEGGRRNPPFQGYFPEFTYDDYTVGDYYHVIPWFCREDGRAHEPGEDVPANVTAHFWIMDLKRRVYIHQPYLKVGVTFTLREGGRITAHGVVTEILDLHIDLPFVPDEPPIENLDA